MNMRSLLHLKSWTPRTAWKRMKATEWTIAFLMIAFVHCAVQLAFQLDARGAHTRAFDFISYILEEGQFQSRIAVLIPGEELYVCKDLPRGSASLDKQCNALWSKEIAQMEKQNSKLRALQTIVPKEQASTIFNPILAGATSAPTMTSLNAPSPTIAMESNDGLFSGGEGDADGSQPGSFPGSGDQGGSADGPDRNLGPGPGGPRGGDSRRPPKVTAPENVTSSDPLPSTSLSPPLSSSPSPTSPIISSTSPIVEPTPPPNPTTSPDIIPTSTPAPVESSVQPTPPDSATEQTTEPPATSTTPEPSTTSLEVETTSTTEEVQGKAPPTETTTAQEILSTTTFLDTSSSSTTTSTSETTTSSELTTTQSETTTSSTAISTSTSSVPETSSTSLSEGLTSSTETSTAPIPQETGASDTPPDDGVNESEQSEDQQDGGDDNSDQAQQQGVQKRSTQFLRSKSRRVFSHGVTSHVGSQAAISKTEGQIIGLYIRKSNGRVLAARSGLDIDAVMTPSNMTGIQIEGLNPAPEGSVDVIYIGPECVESLNWPHQVLGNDLKEDSVFIAFELWVLGISLIAVVGRSVPHLIAVFACHVLSTGWATFTVYRTKLFQTEFDRVIHNGACGGVDLLPLLDAMRRPGEIGSLIVEALSLVITGLVTWKLYNDFGWEIWKLTSGSNVMKRVYRVVLALSVLIQLGLFFMASTGAIWLDQLYNGPVAPFTRHRTIYQVFFTIITILIVPWLVMGWIAVRREMRRTLTTFIVLSFVFLANLTAMFASDVYLLTFTSWRFFAVMTITSSIIAVSVFTLGLICRVNFKHNLGYFLSHQQALNDVDSGRSPRQSSNVSDLEKTFPHNFESQGTIVSEKSSLNPEPSSTSSPTVVLSTTTKPSPVALFKSFLPRHTRDKSSSSSFFSPNLIKADSLHATPNPEILKPPNTPSSPSLNIRNPFASPDDHDDASVYSSDSSLALPATRISAGVGPWTNSTSLTVSPPPSAMLSSIRQQRSIPESPHYTDSSRDSTADRFGGGNPNPKLFPFGNGVSQPFASGIGPLERIVVSPGGPRSAALVGEGGGLGRGGSIKRKGSALGGVGALRPARKYSFGLK